MRTNLPVTQRARDFPSQELLVSQTDERGLITHCNQGFVNVSGYSYEELLGQPHNLVRHPDMPEEAFKDMWQTIGHGRPWSGIVKNRCKNGDHYWVHANVSPVLENGKPRGYISVRMKPTQQQISEAEVLYARIISERGRRPTLRLHAGGVRKVGIADLPARIHRLSLAQRMAIAMFVFVLTVLLPGMLGPTGATLLAIQAGVSLVMASATLLWFRAAVSLPVESATRLARQVAGCNLDGTLSFDPRSPLGALMRNLWLVNLNMRAIVSDVRAEVRGMSVATTEIATGGNDLSARTEAQASSLQQTAAAMEQLTASVRQTAAGARGVAVMGTKTSEVAESGGQSVQELHSTMNIISTSSKRVGEIITLIESLAFQSNILALNAAVEAARAGDQGRGFAVVASEVRSLAQRSAAAAKDIQQVIGASQEDVVKGVERTEGAHSAIAKVLDSVRSVKSQLDEITRMTDEQAEGLAQINAALNHLDGVTQQNAVLAEQSASACEALQLRGGTLIRAVQIFRISSAG